MTAPKTVRLDVLARELGAELHGPGDLEVTGLGTLGAAGPGQLTFLANPRYRAHLENSQAGAVLLRADQLDVCPVAALVVRRNVASNEIGAGGRKSLGKGRGMGMWASTTHRRRGQR